MAVAEIFIGAFITVLFDKLASDDLIKLARSEGIYSKLTEWKDTLLLIQAVLVDAGQKHVTERSVQLWLNNLQDLAYDIDDLLDDLATEALRRRLNEESYASTSANKVLKIIPTCCANFTPRTIMYGRKMSSKLDEITTRLHHLVEKKNILGLNDNVERSNRTSRRPEETSLVDESRIVGREGDKEALLRKLLGNEPCNQNVGIVSIVGLGGIGKTTLARVLYNEKEVKDHFQLMAWVCVSDEFDIFSISKAIFQAVDGGNPDFANLNLLQVALKERLSEKRFLLVLDDVWNENRKEWDILQRPFVAGAPGSKIIVTTRKTMVNLVIDSVQAYSVQPYNLEVLSNEQALSLFAQHSLGEPNFDSHPTLKSLGEGIMKRCDGLPLALITLGGVLWGKKNVEEWEELLNSAIWNLQNDSEILPALRLSYFDLPPHLKQMFAYCSLFPKDYEFDKDELVLLWMAEGFLYHSDDSQCMESLGHKYFEELKSRSFFQHSTNWKSRCSMHDLIHDLAMSVAGEFFFRLDDKMDVSDRKETLEKLHHLSFIRQRYAVYSKFKALQGPTRLRTFLVTLDNSYGSESFRWNKVLVDILPRLPFLRVLRLTNFPITEVPRYIGSLKHIRYLNFSGTGITCLPEQVSDLYNLQSLLVSHCRQLSSLPNSFAKLINLRHLDMSDTPLLNETPLGIGGLTNLQTLSKVIIEGANGFKISELKDLLHIRGQLSIKGLNKVNAIHAKEANLQQKKGLDDLEMEWCDVFDDSRYEKSEYEVLEGLRPHDRLRKLKILFYGGTKLPNWVGDPSFVRLTHLTLRGCRSCICLPTLGHLPSLRGLFVESMNGLSSLDSRLLGSNNSCQGIAFPSLEVLEFENMLGWETWSTSGGDNDGTAGSFPCLRQISIINCPELAMVSIGLIPSLRVLRIGGCSEAVFKSMVGVSSSILRLTMENIKGLTQLHGEVLKHLMAVEYLKISECEELRYLWGSESDAWNILVSLQYLEVDSCEKLVSLGEKEVNLGISLKSVREVRLIKCQRLESFNCPKSIGRLEIRDCPSLTSLKEVNLGISLKSVRQLVCCQRLESYNCPNGIEKLNISDCPSMTSLTFQTVQELPSSLKILEIGGCDNLEESWLLNNFLSSLESLQINRLPNLRSFPEGCFNHLTSLSIENCDNIESIPEKGFGFLPLLCLIYLYIRNCKNLKSFPHEHLQSLTSLKKMWIVDCPSLDCSFPCGLWPPNLSWLWIGGLKKPMSKWGPQNFPTSLVTLSLVGENSGVVSFAEAEDVRNINNNNTSSSFPLPPSLTLLAIFDFMELESLSKGLQHLTWLEGLCIRACPKLRDLPETLLPSLSWLSVTSCPILQERCRSREGNYWPIIAHIPQLIVRDNHNFF